MNNLTYLGIASLLITWLVAIGLLLYIPRNRKPSSAIAWLLVIILFPILGLILFALIGSPKLSRKRRKQQSEIDKKLNILYEEKEKQHIYFRNLEHSRFNQLITMYRKLGGLPLEYASKIIILAEYDKAIADIAQSITSAQKTVYIEYYILALDDTTQKIFDAMKTAIKNGVEVKVLFDEFGSRSFPRYKEMKKLLDEIGAKWHPILPFKLNPKEFNRPDLRNHRKIVAIDGRIGYIGSQNMIDKTYHRKDDIFYDELVVRIEGAAVEQLEIVFASDWYFETNNFLINTQKKINLDATQKIPVQLVPSGSTYDTENNAILFTELFHNAREEIIITNPYFVPNEAILNSIKSAVSRGVSVKIINSEAMDQWMVGHAMRSFYKELLQAGVQIFLFKKPKLLHSKHITIDSDIAIIGSSNMDIRSFELNLECILVMYDKSVVDELRPVQKLNLAKSKQLTLNEWSKRGFWKEFSDSIARLTAALQ